MTDAEYSEGSNVAGIQTTRADASSRTRNDKAEVVSARIVCVWFVVRQRVYYCNNCVRDIATSAKAQGKQKGNRRKITKTAALMRKVQAMYWKAAGKKMGSRGLKKISPGASCFQQWLAVSVRPLRWSLRSRTSQDMMDVVLKSKIVAARQCGVKNVYVLTKVKHVVALVSKVRLEDEMVGCC